MKSTSSALPVSVNDRVSDVLARDEGLVDVFVRHAPHFAKLRNRAMSRVMARLVTVEQAARTANISAEDLVNDLNEALGFARVERELARQTSTASAIREPSPHHSSSAPIVEVDVREDLRSGREPFARIMRP
jgi:hypothetical protein